MEYSTYLGGGSFDVVNGIVVDAAGNAYVTGQTRSSNFPISPGAVQAILNGTDAVVTKLNPKGTAVVYSTFLGGTGIDQGKDIVVDAIGNAYVTGDTSAPDFPTTVNAFQKTRKGGSDIFVTKLNPTGTGLVFSTYLGGSLADSAGAIALGNTAAGQPPRVFIAGNTNGPSDFPTSNPLQPCVGGNGPLGPNHAGIVVGLNGDGSQLLLSTCTSPPGDFLNNSIVVHDEGNLFVAGWGTATPSPVARGHLIRVNDVPIGPCTFRVAPESSIYDAAQQNRVVSVFTQPNCQWTATSDVPWITVDVATSSGVGSRSFMYFVERFTGQFLRFGMINVQDAKVTVTQTDCTYYVTESILTFGHEAGDSQNVIVQTGAGCAWDAFSVAAWLVIGPASGVGNGSFRVFATENTGGARETHIDVTGTSGIAVLQDRLRQ